MMSPSVVASDCHRGFATLSFASRRNSCNISASIEKGSSWSGPAARRFGSNASSGRRSSAMFVSSAADDANKSVVASSSAATALETPRLDDSDGGSDGGEGSNNGGSGGGGPDRGGDGNGDEDGKPSDADVAEVCEALPFPRRRNATLLFRGPRITRDDVSSAIPKSMSLLKDSDSKG